MSWAKELAKLNIDCMSETDATFQVDMVPLNVDASLNMKPMLLTDATFQAARFWLNAAA